MRALAWGEQVRLHGPALRLTLPGSAAGLMGLFLDRRGRVTGRGRLQPGPTGELTVLAAEAAATLRVVLVPSMQAAASRLSPTLVIEALNEDGPPAGEAVSYTDPELPGDALAVLADLHRADDGWWVRAVGETPATDLAGLLAWHGIVPAPPVSLRPGDRLALVDSDRSPLTLLRVSLGWDPVPSLGFFGARGSQIDLDVSTVLLAGARVVDVVSYDKLRTADGAIRHLGDHRTGHGDGDDEVILIDLQRIPVHVDTLVFVVTSYEDVDFRQVTGAFCRVASTTGRELARFVLDGGGGESGRAMAALVREDPTAARGGWAMRAVGAQFDARNPAEARSHLEALIGEWS